MNEILNAQEYIVSQVMTAIETKKTGIKYQHNKEVICSNCKSKVKVQDCKDYNVCINCKFHTYFSRVVTIHIGKWRILNFSIRPKRLLCVHPANMTKEFNVLPEVINPKNNCMIYEKEESNEG